MYQNCVHEWFWYTFYFIQKNVRGVDCDVYITTRTDWPPKTKGYNSTWEWYFARVNNTSLL